MSEEQLKAFLEKVKGDIGLQKKLKAVSGPDAFITIAKEADYALSADDFAKIQMVDISAGELEDIAGGIAPCGAKVDNYCSMSMWFIFLEQALY